MAAAVKDYCHYGPRRQTFNVRPELVDVGWTDREKAYYVKLELDVAAPLSLPLRAPHVSVVYCLQLPSEQARLRLLMELRAAVPAMRVVAVLAQRNDGHNVTVEESELQATSIFIVV
jgi:hypothetical protein